MTQKPSMTIEEQDNHIECWCKICGKKLKAKKEYIDQDDTCNDCFTSREKQDMFDRIDQEFDKRFPDADYGWDGNGLVDIPKDYALYPGEVKQFLHETITKEIV